MKILSSQLRAVGICASFAILAGCSGAAPSSFVPAAPGAMSRGYARSWMAPQATQFPQLLYIADQNPATVYVYSYPQANLVGTLTGFAAPGGECADKAGHVWIPDSLNFDIVEYAHGGSTPIATLSDPFYYPLDCAVDPVTGNLAVTNAPAFSGEGNVAIYVKARGTPTLYSSQLLTVPQYCGYDNRGNLFVDGGTTDAIFQLAEIPKRTNGFVALSVNQTIYVPGGVLWDGKHVAVLDPLVNTIYEFAISENHGTEVGSTPLDDSENVLQFWITGGNVIGGDVGAAYVWPYPAGGGPIKAIVGLGYVYGSVVSKLPAK